MVVLIEKKPTLKIAILATLTLLTLTSVSALTWEAPSSDSQFDNNVVLNFTATASETDNAQLWYSPPNDDSFSLFKDSGQINQDNSFVFNAGDVASVYGDYTFKINSSDSGESKEITGVMLDGGAPSVTLPISDDRLNASDVDFEVTTEDNLVDVSSLSITVENSDGDEVFSESEDNCDSSECSLDVDLSGDLENGKEYDVEVTAVDAVGNEATPSETFTYDNEYEGDEDPRISPQPTVFQTSPDKDEYTFDVVLEEQDPAEPSDITVKCQLGGREPVDAGTQDVSGTTSYECSVEPMRNTQTTLEVFMIDEAGNSVSKEFEYTFDYTQPEVSGLSTVVSVFNSDFEVSYEASDAASEVTDLIYQIDESTLDTDNEKLSVNGSFTVDTSGLDSGSHTLYVWVRDEAGRWSESDSLTFEFRPSAEPKASVSGLGEVRVTAGESKTFTFQVRNTGELLIPSLTFKLETGFSNHTSIVSDLKPGNNRSVSFTVDTSESNLGKHTVSLSSESPDISKTFPLVVEANAEQQQNITSNYQSKLSRFEDLKANVTELMSKVSGERQEQLASDFEELNQTMNEAKQAVEEGRYYKAASLLEGVDSYFSQASQGYEEVKKEYKIAQRNKLIFGFLLFLAVGGIGTVGYFYTNDEYEFDLSAIENLEFKDVNLGDYSLSMEPVNNFVENVREWLEEEEEKAEETFQGFTN
ncbi:hypothetical protein GKQ38_00435 [Candidatus Nanohaloarchaea archaeon]|nr:hypothetical protein GKQ38_00435 [Candidatus Nanohaloarchaea archaeon]